MCLDGDSSPASVLYLNSQLSAQWANAEKCAAHFNHQTNLDLATEEYSQTAYQRSLAQFHYAGEQYGRGLVRKDHLHFSASFGEPKLEFICNHEAILHLEITQGHLNARAIKNGPYRSAVNAKENESLEGAKIAIRIKFDRQYVLNLHPLISASQHSVPLIILDTASSKIVANKSNINADILGFYISKYLDFLRRGGRHVFYDLPNFVNTYAYAIDYSLSMTSDRLADYCQHTDLHGVRIQDINDYLQKRWLKTVAMARGLTGPKPLDPRTACLMEIKSTWLSEAQDNFYITFNPPTISAICAYEGVFYFHVNEVHFYGSIDFDDAEHKSTPVASYKDWQIAVIVDTVKVENELREVIGINLELTTVRLCRELSTKFTKEEEQAAGYFLKITDFIMSEYMNLLIAHRLYELHVFDLLPTDPLAESEPEDDGKILYSQLSQETRLYGFDQITSVPEESVNTTFDTHWRHASNEKSQGNELLVKWNQPGRFDSNFDAIKVQLLSDNQAIVRVNIREGSMTIKGQAQPVEFSSWVIAFIVDIKMVDHHAIGTSGAWLGRFGSSALRSKHTHDNIKHLVLDFANARFLLDQSTLSGLWDTGISLAVLKFENIVEYTKTYLSHVADHGYHIIHSIPLRAPTEEPSGFTLSLVSFQTVSKTNVTIFNRHRVHTPPVLLITGVCRQPHLPHIELPWFDDWALQKTHGHVFLSRGLFLEDRLLPALAEINKKTAILPRFPNPDNNEKEDEIYVSRLEDHPYRKNKKTKWQYVPSVNLDGRKYDYVFTEDWTYQREDSEHQTGASSIHCETSNELLIPTKFHPGFMEIEIKGASVIRVKGKNKRGNWNQRASASWRAAIQVRSEWHGLRVDVGTRPLVLHNKLEFSGDYDTSARDLLSEQLREEVEISSVVTELRRTLEGTWGDAFPGTLAHSLSNPVFTIHGDLILQLRPQDPLVKPATTTTRGTSRRVAGGLHANTIGIPSRSSSPATMDAQQASSIFSPTPTKDSYQSNPFSSHSSASTLPRAQSRAAETRSTTPLIAPVVIMSNQPLPPSGPTLISSTMSNIRQPVGSVNDDGLRTQSPRPSTPVTVSIARRSLVKTQSIVDIKQNAYDPNDSDSSWSMD